jgi:hypothetical protein
VRRTAAVLLGTTALVLLPAGTASAHPLGNFTVNTADRVLVTAEGVQVTHVVDLAEIPSVQLAQPRSGADTDGDGRCPTTSSPPTRSGSAAGSVPCSACRSTAPLPP